MPVTLTELLHQCGTSETDAPMRDVCLHVLRESLPACLSTLEVSETHLPPDARRGIVLRLAADALRRLASVPGAGDAFTGAGVQIGRSRLPEMADTYEREGRRLTAPYEKGVGAVSFAGGGGHCE